MFTKSDKDTVERIYAAPRDYLAKRKLNTAPKTRANISLSDIEQKGLTLESANNLNVPVYRYKTQITLHGIWPDDTQGYCFGYKHIVKNKNGSVGVRYAAIDGLKKLALRRISRYSIFSGYQNSQGTYFVKSYKPELQPELQTAYNRAIANKELFVGNISILHDKWLTGRFYLCIDLDALPKENFWLFCENVLSISKTEYRQAVIAKRAKDNAEEIQRQAEKQAREVLLKETYTKAYKELENAGLVKFTPNGSDFRGVRPVCSIGWRDNTPSIVYQACEVKRKAFGACIMRKSFEDIQSAIDCQFDWNRKARRYDTPIKALYA